MRALLLMFLFLAPVQAAAAPYEGPEMFTSLLRTLGGLGLVLGILLGLYALSRKGRFLGTGRKSEIHILDTRHLGSKKSLCLIRARGRDMLLGISQDRIEMLSHLSREEGGRDFEQELNREWEG